MLGSVIGMSGGANGGFRETFYFYQDNSAIDQTAVALCCLGDAARLGYPTTRAGSVVGIVVMSNEARTTSTLIVDATIATAVTGLQAKLDAAPDTLVNVATQAAGLDTFTAGQAIGVKLTTTHTWAPATADIIVGVTVEY